MSGHEAHTDPGAPAMVRQAGRVVVLDRAGRLLMLRCREPGRASAHDFWITPGGGLHPGETHEQAALRELREEVGLVADALGPCIWTRRHVFAWLGRWYDQRERFFLLQVDGHQVDDSGQTDLEREALIEHHWWTEEAIDAATTAGGRFAPRDLADRLRHLRRHGPPRSPIALDT
jgi:8-oxo-dGTP pyrophosphatase MutT (NUDIX family)